MKLKADSIRKEFAERTIFRDINFEISSGQSLAIVGPNGSGKTTLVRILCGLIGPTKGKISLFENENEIKREHIYKYIGLVGPYLELYEELTARENMNFFAKMKRVDFADEKIQQLIDRVGLKGREDDAVKTFSSGMRQRLKYVFALLDDPQVLFLDEPTSNLDEEGIEIVYEIMVEQKMNKILVLATNDKDDLKFGDLQIAVAS